MTASDPRRTIDAIWRMESAKLIGALARIVRDVGIAEDLAQDALVAALVQGLGGLTTGEIARAFLVSEPTIAQHAVRAKRALQDASVHFEVPRGEALAARLASVVEVIALVFNEGYSATAGDVWMRPGACE